MYQRSKTGEQIGNVSSVKKTHTCASTSHMSPPTCRPHSQAYGSNTSSSVTWLQVSGSLVGDIILVVLDHVIGPAPVAEETVLDDLHDKICSLPF